MYISLIPADLSLGIAGLIQDLHCILNKWEKPRQKQIMQVILKSLTFEV